MALTLRSGGESRLDGAPDQLLPPFADGVEALAQAILADDTDNVYGGDINLARQIARQQLGEMSARSRAGQAAAEQAGADRNRARAARQGVSPESLPMDEYGAVSGRTVQEANRPLPEAEAALGMEQEAADAIIRGLREGTPVFGPQGDLDFLRERGERNPLEPNGRTDMAMRARIRERRGQFAEMPDGTRIPIGAEPTDAQIRREREWQEWANQTPGTERQALYDPAGYEEFREGVRQDIQDRARQDMETYGGQDPSKWTDEQRENRYSRTGAEWRQADSDTERELKISRMARKAGVSREEARRMLDEGRRAAGFEPGEGRLTGPQRRMESQSLRDMAGSRRDAELAQRRQNRIDQAMMAGGQPTGGPFGTRATTTAINQLGPGWREIAILDRLTGGRVGGPTPLGVDAAGAQNAMRFINNEAIAGMDPLRRQAAQAQMEQQVAALPGEQKVALSIARGEPMGTGLSAGPVNAAWNEAWTEQGFREQMEGMGYQPAEIDAWIDERRNGPAEGPPVARPPAAPPRPYAGGQVPSQPPVTGRAAPPPGAHQWHGGRGQQIPSGAGRGNGR